MALSVEWSAKHIRVVLDRGLADIVSLNLKVHWHSNIVGMIGMGSTEVLSESAAVPQDTKAAGHCTRDHDAEGAGGQI